MQSSQDGVWKIYNAQLSSILSLLLGAPSLKFQPNRMNGSSFYTPFFFASVLLFPLPGVPFPIANPALSFNILLKYCLLHETFPDSSARRAHFCLSNPWHLVQSYPAERAESLLLLSGPRDRLLGPRKLPGGLPLGWRLMLAGGY